MADTIPVVHWALEMRCGLRAGENSYLPGKGALVFWVAQEISRALSEKEGTAPIVGDVFVTDCRQKSVPGSPTGERWRDYPSKGWVISEVFKHVEGGLNSVWKMCGGCVA